MRRLIKLIRALHLADVGAILADDRDHPESKVVRAMARSTERVPERWRHDFDQFRDRIVEELQAVDRVVQAHPDHSTGSNSRTLIEWRAAHAIDAPMPVSIGGAERLAAHYEEVAVASLAAFTRFLRTHRTEESALRFPPPAIFRHDFELLVLDILLLEGVSARFSPPEEDLFEKTDLRVSFPDLERRRGARVQVKFSSHPGTLSTTIAEYAVPNEYVFVSPITLALAKRKDLHDKPGQILTEAKRLQAQFREAMERAKLNGDRPATHVPDSTRRLIAEFVRDEAFRSTEAVRAREATMGRVGHSERVRKSVRSTDGSAATGSEASGDTASETN
ncbi:MAG: hypothetical protein SFX74_05715 [Fimbriimonadaceae bacterium]|nr:hypothetical protein [Fimbriimonadaceae bacterium]